MLTTYLSSSSSSSSSSSLEPLSSSRLPLLEGGGVGLVDDVHGVLHLLPHGEGQPVLAVGGVRDAGVPRPLELAVNKALGKILLSAKIVVLWYQINICLRSVEFERRAEAKWSIVRCGFVSVGATAQGVLDLGGILHDVGPVVRRRREIVHSYKRALLALNVN